MCVGGYPGWSIWGVPQLVHPERVLFRDHFHDHFWGGSSSMTTSMTTSGGSHVIYPIMHLMLPLCSPDTKWWVWLGAPAYIVLPQSIIWRSNGTPKSWTDWLTDKRLKTLPSLTLRMLAVMNTKCIEIWQSMTFSHVDVISLPSKHCRGAKVPNLLHSLTLAQICHIFKYFKGGLSLSSRNSMDNSCT